MVRRSAPCRHSIVGALLSGVLLMTVASAACAAPRLPCTPTAPPLRLPESLGPKLSSALVSASWYGPRHQGRATASGGIFDANALTAAHPSLPFGTRLMVTNPRNGRMVEVCINDRGPFASGRSLDLSEAAARMIGIHGSGVAAVLVAVIR